MERAKKNKEKSNQKPNNIQLLTFNIDVEEFGINLQNIFGVNRMVAVTKVPDAPDSVKGIINLRGKMIPIVDLRSTLGISEKCYDRKTRFIVIETGDKYVGIIVDSVNDVLKINTRIMETSPEMISNLNSEYIQSVGKLDDRLLNFLNLEKVISNLN